ncbi:phospholipase D-like domain-containing protein [Phenylobacterium sp. J367]|uniref:phospholipase D-like domain-containing protein n=1 Tax=Phenylobacterium sp. J367 TaxID=2898435 RepID=UPI002151B736|nr:phospholipase D-like domain-containing protein [Phenylobacterium sp. J367]MCR5881008.1 phospholipase D-like domain-containing protein [Phenylobacterium sp. J367]
MSALRSGDTVWRTARADRAAFLIDTEAYFTAVFDAFHKARRSILLLGWGFDPRTRLFPDGYDGPDDPDEVGRILVDLACARPDLDVRLLIWKSALPISATQEFFPHKARKFFKDTPVKFVLDDHVPFGACHHQKVLVIDDRLAFCGGGDIAVDRWDTAGHRDDDPRRIMPKQECHAPRHEVMMMVDGPAAAALGDLARERWRRATGETVAPPPDAGGDPWPDHVPPHLREVEVGIARTEPDWKSYPLVNEIQKLTLAGIAEATDTIYLENQYFTSPLVCEALAARLAEPNGPEVVMISTGVAPSWFDRLTMDRTRGTMIWRLRAADVFGRFKAFYPRTQGGEVIIVHSKVSVFDDRLARVGSANLNNRSGGFDTECELAVECHDEAHRLTISAFRDRLVGHFMGVTGDAVAKARAEFGGLCPAIDALNREGRLAPIEPPMMTGVGEFIAAYHIGDPVDTADSWRLARRRERLMREARQVADDRSLTPPGER